MKANINKQTQVKEALFVSVQNMGQALVLLHDYLIKSIFFFLGRCKKGRYFLRGGERESCTEGYSGKERNQSAWGGHWLESINDIY